MTEKPVVGVSPSRVQPKLVDDSLGETSLERLASTIKSPNPSVTVVSWGGRYTESQKHAYYEPFESATNIKIKTRDYNGGLSEIRSQVNSGRVEWDIVDVEYPDAAIGCAEGLFEKIDPNILPKSPNGLNAKDDFIDGSITECAVANIVWSTTIGYDRSQFLGVEPKSLKDFFDISRFPGGRGLKNSPKGNLEFALLAEGVDPKNIYSELATDRGVRRAFAKLDTIKSHVRWWENGRQSMELINSRSVSMSTAYNGRWFNSIVLDRKNFEIIWDGQILDFDMWAIPKGARNISEAKYFLAFSTDTKQLAEQTKFISYGPARQSSNSFITKYHGRDVKMAPFLPTTPANLRVAILNGHDFWAKNESQLTRMFSNWKNN